MKKSFVALITGIAVLIFFAAAPGYSQDDVKTVDDSAFTEKKRPVVYFPHDAHNEKAEIESCNYCHHTYENGVKSEDASSEDQECSECHFSGGAKGADNLARVYHIACKSCHEQVKQGPVMCGECHNKEKEKALKNQL
ncbi:putative tmc redox complex, acidic cyctchrome c [Desulfonema limicola]|uniref:Tmc redox complex, acidic cyctchrome c n=1 Tax=Desulfonema limicola TaxID=45656 RepID=A0A975BC79_9BACT|nr:cytochrome c3 family protein [Desulfonema limicola]QTA82585.1 putative tmc redox complex, acidic cyctchrome c [Desulfonema limicola]